MIKTKIKRVLAFLALAGIIVANTGNTLAATQIGTGSVSGTGAFDSAIMWDDTFPGSASGSVSGIIVTATVDPNLNMVVSTGTIALGTLAPNVTTTGSLNLEVGTNAADGVVITARSGSGGLTKIDDNSVQINSGTTDGISENFTYSSVAAATDSTVIGFSSTGDLSPIEVNDNVTEHTIYQTNKPEPTTALDDVAFSVAATINAMTQAGDYQDTVTFTVTGTF